MWAHCLIDLFRRQPVPDDARAGFSGLWTNGVWKRKIFKDAIGTLSCQRSIPWRPGISERDRIVLSVDLLECVRRSADMSGSWRSGSRMGVYSWRTRIFFKRGVLLSESLWLEMLRDAGSRALISVSAPMNAHDQAFFAG